MGSPSSFFPWPLLLFRPVSALKQSTRGAKGGKRENRNLRKAPTARNPILLFSDWEGIETQRRKVTCPRPHSNAIAKSRLSGRHAGSPAFSYLAAFPAQQGPEARTSGPSAQSRVHACGRGQWGERWEAREGHSLPITKLQDVVMGAGRRRRVGG